MLALVKLFSKGSLQNGFQFGSCLHSESGIAHSHLQFRLLGYRKRRDAVPLLIGIAFGLFGISHLVTLFGLAADWTNVLIAIRVLAYLTVIYALYKYVTMKAK